MLILLPASVRVSRSRTPVRNVWATGKRVQRAHSLESPAASCLLAVTGRAPHRAALTLARHSDGPAVRVALMRWPDRS